MFFDFEDILQHFKFVNWRIRFLMSRTGYSSTDPATNSEKRVLNFQINCIFLTKNPQRNLIYVQMKFFYLVKTSESNFCNWLVSKINILKSETFLVTWQIFIIVDDNFTTFHRQTVISSGKFTLRAKLYITGLHLLKDLSMSFCTIFSLGYFGMISR